MQQARRVRHRHGLARALAALLAAASAGCREAPAPAAPAVARAAESAPAPSAPPAEAAPAAPAPALAPEQGAAPAQAAAPQGGVLPAAVSPFPAGLRGTLVFQSDREGRPKIYTIDLASGRVTRLTAGADVRDENPRWSPDGTRIVFRSNRAHYGPGADPGAPQFDLYLMNADGGGVRRLTTTSANEYEASWHPDGRSLVFTSDRDSRGDLYRLWLADGRVERLTRHFVGRAIMPSGIAGRHAGRVRGAEPEPRAVLAVSGAHPRPGERHDGGGGERRRFLLAGLVPGGGQPRLRAAGSGTLGTRTGTTGGRRPTDAGRRPALWSYYPDYSPDGKSIAFSVSPAHHDGENWDLAVMSVDRPGAFTPLTTGPGNDRLPDWKP